MQAVAILVSILAALTLAPLTQPGGQKDRPAQSAAPEARAFGLQETRHTIFYAVLEGLYADGVSNDVVDVVLALDPAAEGETAYPSNFVWGCPICMPAYDAFRVYRARPKLTAYKGEGEIDTWGAGLAPEMTERITSKSQSVRQAAIEELVARWIGARMDLMRLTDSERRNLQHVLEDGRKQGMVMLKDLRAAGAGASYSTMKTCPFCEGACKPQ